MKALVAVVIGVLIAAVAVGAVWMRAHGYHTITMTRAPADQP